MKKGTSSTPLILGVLGLLTALPNAVISLISGSFITSAIETSETSKENTEMVFFYMSLIFWSAVVGSVASLFAKRLYFITSPIMLIAGVLIFVSMVMGNLFLIFPASFFVIGGLVCLTQKKV